jgi:outer membrane protein assembly factor BamB
VVGFASRVTGGWRRGRPRLVAVLAAAAVCAAVTGCGSGSPGTGTGSGEGSGAPPITILTHGADNDNGDIFIAPEGQGYANGPEILTNTGKVVWFHPLSGGQTANDFRTQTYLGQPVLTWIQSSANDRGGTYEIYTDRYRPLATFTPANGYVANFHEFLITPSNTALILANTITTANLSSMGGPSDQMVMDGVVQEIDIKTGRLLFQWNSADHVPYRDSHMPMPGGANVPWDWFHINAVHLDTDGNLLIDSRNTWTTYKVNIHTGQIIWELGGKQSSFTLKAAPGQVLDHAGEIFAWQHDPEAIGNNEYTLFDDESGGELLSSSRVVTVRLDLQTHVATLIKSDNQPEGLVAGAMGNAQTTRNGDLFVGWGALPYISEFSPSGQLLFNAELPTGITTYRAYRLPWNPGV